MKNERYVQKHGIITGDLLYVRNISIERFFAETLDDVADVLTQPSIIEFVAELKAKVKDLLRQMDQIRIKQLLPERDMFATKEHTLTLTHCSYV
jgi:hypothetical protein